MINRALLTFCVGLAVYGEAAALPANTPNYPAPASAPSDGAIYEVLGRLEQLQSEVQQLRGMVEEQSQTITDLQRKQGNMYTDLDERMQALTAGGTPPGQPQTAPQSPAASDASTAAAATAQAAPAPVAAQAPASVTPAPVVEIKSPAPAAQGNEKERYQQAYDTLRNGRNAQAVQMFEALLADYPAGEFADNAQYWLAEAYKINRDNDKARAAFGKVISQYPNSSKVPDALLKLGYIEFDQQNMAKARDYLTRVTTSYPGSTASHLASKKLAQMAQ